jgi:hypothetical protein
MGVCKGNSFIVLVLLPSSGEKRTETEPTSFLNIVILIVVILFFG